MSAPRMFLLWVRHSFRAASLLVFLVLFTSCGDAHDVSQRKPEIGAVAMARVSERLAVCAQCHEKIVDAYLGHGMAHSLGVVETLPEGRVVNPESGDEYVYLEDDQKNLMRHVKPDGGVRTQQVMGRYGAGVLDMSFIGSELDRDGKPVSRMSFLPLEQLRGHGLGLSPFEIETPGTGFDMPFATECLSCHTTQDVSRLPGAARDTDGERVWPGNDLGANAFDHLNSLGCDACHGPVDRHVELMLAAFESGEKSPELGFQRLGELPAGRQRDVCAKCHLQGDGHMELEEIARGGPQPPDFLLRRPVLVSADPGDDFHFVSQVQRLSLSACFDAPGGMTCTTCHEPHSSVAAQGTASFDARCMTCHTEEHICKRPKTLQVQDVTGDRPRTSNGCVDCHMRRSQPFDLPHVRTADHFVRREITPPETLPMRDVEDASGEMTVFDDGRFAELLATPEGRSWVDTLVGLRLSGFGRIEDAFEMTKALPPAGSVIATRPEPWFTEQQEGWRLPSLRQSAVIHHLRGLMFEATGDLAAAQAAYTDALRLDPSHPQARLNRANIELSAGNLEAALSDAAELQRRYPRAEKPWNLRALAAGRAQDAPALVAALIESTWLWPADPAAWQMLGQGFLAMGRPDDARKALQEALRLQPGRHGLAEDLRRANGTAP
ncbi:MAG: tetratricopeptide repeat protein [Planctomycetota bacterium]|jgi:Flp pilus assembly protein TadD|nr:tetratricopeptide repeat protein [Planctomycetota bacterium]